MKVKIDFRTNKEELCNDALNILYRLGFVVKDIYIDKQTIENYLWCDLNKYYETDWLPIKLKELK